jgi:uncharacterized membrane protein
VPEIGAPGVEESSAMVEPDKQGAIRHNSSLSERARMAASALVALVVAVPAALLSPWQLSVLVGWDVAAIVFIGWTWLRVGRLDGEATRTHAQREDTGRDANRALMSLAAVASLAGVILALALGNRVHGALSGVLTATAISTVIVSWTLVHTLFTLRYADLYYGGDPGGIDFNSETPPDFRDFAYVSFTVGMTYQIADTSVTDNRLRRVVLVHSLLSYLFGAVIIGLAINLLAGLVG